MGGDTRIAHGRALRRGIEARLNGDHAAIVVLQYEQLAARSEKAAVMRKHFRS
jgi:hypothetical protein